MKIYQIDAFTEKPFTGNPAVVCFLESEKDNVWMQKVAMEMNLSETAFLIPKEGGYDLKWFTPTVEVDLCGHATLASAHAIWEEALRPKDTPVDFYSKSGTLTARFTDGWIEMDFPSLRVEKEDPPEGLLEALHVQAVFTGRNSYDYLVEVASETTLRKMRPDFMKLVKIDTRGVIVTARGTEHDFVSRFFAPAAGIAEDPVTGSAHCALAPYWCEKLKKDSLTGFQASERGGIVRVRNGGERVVLAGKAVTVLTGNLVGFD
jgi:predicted PhzF superfamily epimerase YddE/YHI9